MKRMIVGLAALVLAATAAGGAAALDRAAYDDLERALAEARTAEADVFAPKAWAKATEARDRAEKELAAGRKQEQLDKRVAEAREFLENARKATEVCKLALEQHLGPRDRARRARAPELVPPLYAEAEARFLKATAKVESGDVKGGLREAQEAGPLFDTAELEAVRVDVMGEADRLLAQAVADEAERYAAATLDRARTSRRDANSLLTKDRTAREPAIKEARDAAYEARHASTIAQSVRSLARNDQAWEKLMLLYEIQMDRAGAALGCARLPFDQGPQAAADTLVARSRAAREESARWAQAHAELAARLRQTAARVGLAGSPLEGLELAQAIDRRLDELLAEQRDLAASVEAERSRLAELSQEHATVAGELSVRVEREEKFRRARALISPLEGEVLTNATNDVVLRLTALVFESGKSDLREAHLPLLEKVKEIVAMYGGSRVVVEGHTDARGDAGGNLRLSERRALAVVDYLRKVLELPADRITAVGYGSERPVASNQTPEGQAKNRRIDVIIMP